MHCGAGWQVVWWSSSMQSQFRTRTESRVLWLGSTTPRLEGITITIITIAFL